MDADADDVDLGLLNISLTDAEGDDEDEKTLGSRDGSTRDATRKADRTKQSEAAFQTLKDTYRPKMENGEIWKQIAFPLPDDLHKSKVEDVMHAVEELYFFRRYEEGLRFVDRVFAPESNSSRLHVDVCALLRLYQAKCREKLTASSLRME